MWCCLGDTDSDRMWMWQSSSGSNRCGLPPDGAGSRRPVLATLLSHLAFTLDPLDYLFPWMLLQALQAIAAIPEAASLDEVR